MGRNVHSRSVALRGALIAALALSGAAAGVAGAAGAADEPEVAVWQWTDRDGVTRYTPDFGRIPGYAREGAVEMRPGAGPPTTTPVYFEPNPRAPVVGVPGSVPPTSVGSAEPGPAPAATSAEPADDLDSRIRQLEAQIASDEEALKQLISAPGAEADVEVSPELREIAARLPQLQAQLASLQKRRGGLGSP